MYAAFQHGACFVLKIYRRFGIRGNFKTKDGFTVRFSVPRNFMLAIALRLLYNRHIKKNGEIV